MRKLCTYHLCSCVCRLLWGIISAGRAEKEWQFFNFFCFCFVPSSFTRNFVEVDFYIYLAILYSPPRNVIKRDSYDYKSFIFGFLMQLSFPTNTLIQQKIIVDSIDYLLSSFLFVKFVFFVLFLVVVCLGWERLINTGTVHIHWVQRITKRKRKS